jgi:hypothetical protein
MQPMFTRRREAIPPPLRCRRLALLGAVLLAAAPWARALDDLRSFDHPNLGKVSFLAPVDWIEELRTEPGTGTVTLRLVTQRGRPFDLEIDVNDLNHLQQELLMRRDIEGHVRAGLAEMVARSSEHEVSPHRFGLRREESLYARLTDAAATPGEYRFLSKGVRLLGRRAMLFTLYSNDSDGALLERVLDLVSSFTFQP